MAETFGRKWKNPALSVLLVMIATVGPLIAYAGVTLLYSQSEHTVRVNTTPPISFLQGSDYSAAQNASLATGFATQDNGAAFLITLSGINGGNYTIDKYVHVSKNSGTTSYKVQIATAIAGTLDATEIQDLKVRFWTGGTAPTTNYSSGVCAFLNLEDAVNTESSGTCTASTVYVQVVFQIAENSAGSSTVAIRPSSIVFT